MKSEPKPLFFFLIILLIFIVRVFPYRQSFLQRFDAKALENLYQHSQFSQNPADRTEIIRDHDLYAYSGWYYLKTGDLRMVNIEHPPLGKYLIGLSILLFHNQNIMQIPLAITLLWITYLLAYKILKSPWLAVLVPLALILENLFLKQTTQSLLDLPQAVVIGLFCYLALAKKNPYLLGILLGAVSSIKFPATAIILGLSFLIHSALTNKRQSIKAGIVVLITALGFYLLTYTPLFLKQGPAGVASLHIRALKIHLSHLPKYPPFVPLKVMFLNQWPVWWDEKNPIHQTEEWNIFWPVLGAAILLSPLFYWLKYKKSEKKQHLLFFLFNWLYFIFLNSRLFFPSYLFLILPYFYLFFIWEIKLLLSEVKKLSVY